MPLPIANDQVQQADRSYQAPVDDGSDNTLAIITGKLLGINGYDRYQTWPERLVREAISAPHDVMTQGTLSSEDLIKPALAMSALAGTGGLAGAGEDVGAASLGSGPFLRPALKYQGKIYKAPVGGQHMDAIPQNLQAEFTRQAMSGEDISNFNFGFLNHKGHFLEREDALKYAIDNGLLSPHDAKFGALTSTMRADSSKEGAAIKTIEDYRGQHSAPDAESGSPLHDVTANGIYPKDFYGPNGLKYYGTGDDNLDFTSYNKIQNFKDKPDEKVKIYRAIPWEGKKPDITLNGNNERSKINPGDWVTISRQYAKDHGESALNGKYAISMIKVPAKELFTSGDSFHEWGWQPSGAQ